MMIKLNDNAQHPAKICAHNYWHYEEESSSTCIFACLTLTMLTTVKIPIVYAIKNC